PEKRHPMVFVFLTLPPQDVDVNVHPHKTEVRFLHPDLVHAVVREAIQRGLSRTTVDIPTVTSAESAATLTLPPPTLPIMPQESPPLLRANMGGALLSPADPHPPAVQGLPTPQTILPRSETPLLKASPLVPSPQ